MKLYKVTVVFIMVLCTAMDVHADEPNITETTFPRKAFEMILTKLNDLQDKIVALESATKPADLKLSDEMSKLSRRMEEKLSATQQNHLLSVKESIDQKLNEVVNQMSHNVSALHEQSKTVEHTVNTQHEQMRVEMQKLAFKEDLAWFKIDPDRYYQNISITSCTNYPLKQSGKYKIQLTELDDPFWAYCAQTSFGGGWLVFQHRYDGSVNFFRNWTEYRDGFGDVDKEFWLGLERLHRLTSARPHELLVELKDFNGKHSYARYDMFQIGNEEEQYAMTQLGKYTGTAGDALTGHRGMKFSTADRDNDSWMNGNCASEWSAAWWYEDCGETNLNGPYSDNNNYLSMYWGRYKSKAYTRMMIREK